MSRDGNRLTFGGNILETGADSYRLAPTTTTARAAVPAPRLTPPVNTQSPGLKIRGSHRRAPQDDASA
ncbi:hypothetical protein [Pilimelia columellifera]|uniref:Uncharacterized protein n=1 Tax=Pilimelia columellifera subsp. columellifera TaxID=706583 RepID=A0ABP6B132_9ACTN